MITSFSTKFFPQDLFSYHITQTRSSSSLRPLLATPLLLFSNWGTLTHPSRFSSNVTPWWRLSSTWQAELPLCSRSSLRATRFSSQYSGFTFSGWSCPRGVSLESGHRLFYYRPAPRPVWIVQRLTRGRLSEVG